MAAQLGRDVAGRAGLADDQPQPVRRLDRVAGAALEHGEGRLRVGRERRVDRVRRRATIACWHQRTASMIAPQRHRRPGVHGAPAGPAARSAARPAAGAGRRRSPRRTRPRPRWRARRSPGSSISRTRSVELGGIAGSWLERVADQVAALAADARRRRPPRPRPRSRARSGRARRTGRGSAPARAPPRSGSSPLAERRRSSRPARPGCSPAARWPDRGTRGRGGRVRRRCRRSSRRARGRTPRAAGPAHPAAGRHRPLRPAGRAGIGSASPAPARAGGPRSPRAARRRGALTSRSTTAASRSWTTARPATAAVRTTCRASSESRSTRTSSRSASCAGSWSGSAECADAASNSSAKNALPSARSMILTSARWVSGSPLADAHECGHLVPIEDGQRERLDLRRAAPTRRRRARNGCRR